MASAAELARIFKLLSVETRVRLVRLVNSRPMCVGALARTLGITDAAASQHLRVLRDSGLVTADRQGYFVHYRVNAETLAQWKNEVDAFLAGHENDVAAPCCPTPKEKEVKHA